MTTYDLTAEIARLCAAVDAGDDSVLPILADALEEARDKRAAGLRELMAGKHHRGYGDGKDCPARPIGRLIDHQWTYSNYGNEPHHIRWFVYERLKGGRAMPGRYRLYSTRSAAYLDLAEALIGLAMADHTRQ